MLNRSLCLCALVLLSHAAAGGKRIDSPSPCLWINPSAQPELICGTHFVCSVEALVWQAYENGLPLAIRTKNPLIVAGEPELGYLPTLQGATVENLNFDWNGGFRLGIGDIWTVDHIDLNLTWLWLRAKGSRHLSAGSGEQLQAAQLHPVDGLGNQTGQVVSTNPSFAHADAHWRADLNQLDLDGGRAFYIAKWVSVRPHCGLRTTWLQQHLKAKYNDNLVTTGFLTRIPPTLVGQGDNYGVRKLTKWWGIGPEAGLELRLGSKAGWSLFADVAGSEEVGIQSLGRKDFDATLAAEGMDSTLVAFKDSFWMTRPILDLQLGVAWETLFKDQRRNLLIEAGWEQHVYYSQNQFPFFPSPVLVGNFNSEQGDLSYQGMRFAVQLDF